MWADTLLSAEQAFLLRFLIWGAASAALGLGILATEVLRRARSPLLEHFAIQIALWGALAVILALLWRWRADLRDYAGAARLVRVIHVMLALDAGIIGAGAALAVRGWRQGRIGSVGAGAGMLAQGLGWLVLHAGFAMFLRSA